MAKEKYFHFTLGPVQSFVAQARRTRDFWAGSFLLSWLSGVAMVAVREQQGTIEFPIPPADYLEWIKGKGRGEAPRQGGIPNRFKSIQAKVPENFDASRVVQTVRQAWQALAEHIWVQDHLGEVADQHGSGTRSIWERQHANFWDMSWVLTDDPKETSLLDQRKNWRSHGFTQNEAGVKCMVMDGWQELSGATTPGQEGKRFWEALRATRNSGIRSDLGENEQLCALAYVKRRFARHFATFATTLKSNGAELQLQGWPLSPSIPSVAYMAAVHWLESLVQTGQPDEVRTLLQAAQAVAPDYSEWDTDIACLGKAVSVWDANDASHRLLSLDGNIFFEHVQQQPQAKGYGYDPQKMRAWCDALHHFERQHPEFSRRPSPFYAILLMDGDSLGSHMSDATKQHLISSALLKFTDGVPEIVEQNNGFLVYAGGDDVLAILPLEDAMTCAAQVRAHYLDCFESSKIPTTISAAIEFVHVKTPLGKVLGDAHKLLDDVAKDGAGRDALAVRVWKTSGQVLEWAQPWKIALRDGQANGELVVQQLARHFTQDSVPGAHDGGDGPVRYSSKFFYKIEERFTVLNPAKAKDKDKATSKGHRPDHTAETAPVLSEEQALDLLAVDFWASADNRKAVDIERARSLIKPLLQQCRAHQRKLKDNKEIPPELWERSPQLRADGALLVRFLATKGLEQGDNL